MAILFTKPDDTALTGVTFTIERGVPSAAVATKIKNTGATAVSGAFLSMYAETTPGSGIFATTGEPHVDEQMGRFEITGQDSTATPGQEVILGVEQVMGHLAIAKLPTLLPGDWILADIWLEQSTTSAAGGAVNCKFEVSQDRTSIPIGDGISDIGTGVLTGVGQAENFLISARETTATGTPDDEVHTAAGSWLLMGAEYTDGTIRDTAFNQNDGAVTALTTGQKYIAALTQSSANAPTVTKGLRATTPVKPTPPTGELLLAWITVNYSAGATVISSGDIESSLTYGRLLVTAGTGLNAVVHSGKAIAVGYMQVKAIKETVALTASATNRIWLTPQGVVVKTLSDTPPAPGAHWLANVVTDATTVTSIVDKRTFVQTPGSVTAHAASHATAASDPVTPAAIGAAATAHTHAEADVTSLVSDLAAKAALASPTFTGAPLVPTATLTDNTTKASSTAFVKGQGYLRADGTTLPTAALNVDNHKVTNLSTPTDAQDAVTKAYADAISAGAVANDSITFAKIQNIAASKLLGRATASVGDTEEIALGTNLSFTGTTLNAAGGGTGHTVKEAGAGMTARTGLNFLSGFDLTDDAGGDETEVALDLSEAATGGDLSWAGNVPTIPNDTVTFAKMQDIATAKLLGRATAATGNVEEITLGTNLSYTGTTLNAAGGSGGDSTRKGAEAALPAASNDGDLYFTTDGFRLHRDTGAAYNTWGPIFPLVAPDDSAFAWINQGGASVSSTNGAVIMTVPTGTSPLWRIRKKAAPATPYTITAMFLPHLYPNGIANLCWRQSSDGKLVGFSIANISGAISYNVTKMDSATSYNSDYLSWTSLEPMIRVARALAVYITDDGTNRTAGISFDGGVTKIQLHTIGRTDFLTADEVGWYEDPHASQTGYQTLLSWKQE